MNKNTIIYFPRSIKTVVQNMLYIPDGLIIFYVIVVEDIFFIRSEFGRNENVKKSTRKKCVAVEKSK